MRFPFYLFTLNRSKVLRTFCLQYNLNIEYKNRRVHAPYAINISEFGTFDISTAWPIPISANPAGVPAFLVPDSTPAVRSCKL